MEGKYELAIIKEDPIIKYFIEHWKTHPSDFVEYVLGIKLLDYQKIYLDKAWNNRMKISLYYRR